MFHQTNTTHSQATRALGLVSAGLAAAAALLALLVGCQPTEVRVPTATVAAATAAATGPVFTPSANLVETAEPGVMTAVPVTVPVGVPGLPVPPPVNGTGQAPLPPTTSAVPTTAGLPTPGAPTRTVVATVPIVVNTPLPPIIISPAPKPSGYPLPPTTVALPSPVRTAYPTQPAQ